jgi:hypothetical protein
MSNQFGGAVCGLIYSKKSVPYPPSEKKHSFFFFKKKKGRTNHITTIFS